MRSGSTGEPLEVVDLPAGEIRTRHGPVLTGAVCGEDKGALLGAHQNSDRSHFLYLLPLVASDSHVLRIHAARHVRFGGAVDDGTAIGKKG